MGFGVFLVQPDAHHKHGMPARGWGTMLPPGVSTELAEGGLKGSVHHEP